MDVRRICILKCEGYACDSIAAFLPSLPAIPANNDGPQDRFSPDHLEKAYVFWKESPANQNISYSEYANGSERTDQSDLYKRTVKSYDLWLEHGQVGGIGQSNNSEQSNQSEITKTPVQPETRNAGMMKQSQSSKRSGKATNSQAPKAVRKHKGLTQFQRWMLYS